MPIFTILFGVLVLAGAFFLLIGYRVFSGFAVRGKQGKNANLRQEGAGEYTEWFFSQHPEEHHLKTADGVLLCGRLLRAEKPRGATVLLLHGYLGTGPDHMGMFVPFYLNEGFDVFVPDHRAHGDSEGKYIGFGETDADDCAAWCRYLDRMYDGKRKLLLHGVSMGGATACGASAKKDLPRSVCGVVSDCAFSSCVDQFSYSLRFIVSLSPKFLLPAANFWCKRLARYDIFTASAAEHIKKSTLPFLFIHGADDKFVPTEMVYQLFDACPDEGKILWVVPDAKHFVSYTVAKEEYEARLRTFFERIGI
ncbi:MAG: alpha/beta hydrolase [Clostridia bacterium]|nr:alpha/beta hydrolase [Clostridia bacterium]